MTTYTKADLVLLRSDTGDGGWSLHLRGDEDYEGIPFTLVSGPAELVDDEWSRPNTADYAAALAKLNADIKVDVYRGPKGGYGFRKGWWPVKIDGEDFEVFDSVSHSCELDVQERLVTESARIALRRNGQLRKPLHRQ